MLACLCAAGATALFAVERSAQEGSASAASRLAASARSVESEIQPVRLSQPSRLRAQLDGQRRAEPGLRSITVSGRSGGRLVTVASGERSSPAPRLLLRRPLGDAAPNTTLRRRLVRGGSVSGTSLLLAYDAEDWESSFAKSRHTLALEAALVALLIALLASMVLTRSVFKPLGELRRATTRIKNGERGTRLNWRRSDEIGLLAREFDSMAAELEETHSRLEGLALEDPVTALPNRRAFEERLQSELRRARREMHCVALVALDIDRFKEINDRSGHAVGDQALKLVAGCIRDDVRPGDVCGRVGGDEFMLALVGTDAAGALEVMNRIRAGVSATRIAGEAVRLTISVGVSEFPRHSVDENELMRLADQAMYASKLGGRDCCTIYSPDFDPESGEEAAEEARKRALVSTVQALAKAVDAKDGYIHAHSKRVAAYATTLAESLGMTPERVDMIRAAGLLHDIGKIGTPDSILRRIGPLRPAEVLEMRRHSELGREILAGAGMSEIADWVLHLHERWDGAGYPDGVAGEEIPLESRVLHAADALEAMTSTRVYRDALPLARALDELEAGAGTQFDPHAVRALAALARQGMLDLYAEPGDGRLTPAA